MTMVTVSLMLGITGKSKIYSLSVAQPFPGSWNHFEVQIGFHDHDMCHLIKELRQLKTCYILEVLLKNVMRIVCVHFKQIFNNRLLARFI
jgi:hypothetical protein